MELPIRVQRVLGRTSTVYEGSTIPRWWLRRGGVHFKSDAAFVESGEREADRLVALGLAPGASVLEIGCGPGRLAIGLLRRLGDGIGYEATDVDADAVAWCRRHVERVHPSYRFHVVDSRNDRYNPDGIDDERLPFPDATFHFAYLYSVFSHTRSEEVRAYLREIRRVLRGDGKLFLTAFVETGVPDEEENPAGYVREWKGPLHCVRYERGFFTALLRDADLELVSLEPGETDGQSAVVASPRVADTAPRAAAP